MDEIKAQGLLFFLAEYDTTANALCWLIYSLACNPEIQEKVHQEIEEVVGDKVRGARNPFGDQYTSFGTPLVRCTKNSIFQN